MSGGIFGGDGDFDSCDWRGGDDGGVFEGDVGGVFAASMHSSSHHCEWFLTIMSKTISK